MSYNNAFYEIDPTDSRIRDEDAWWILKEDMLQLKHDQSDKLIDLGWYPEGNVKDGRYTIQVYDGDFTGTLLQVFESNQREIAVKELERIAYDITSGRYAHSTQNNK